MKDNGQFWIYTIFVIIALLGVFYFSGEYLNTKKENYQLKEVLMQQEDNSRRITTMSVAINDLRRELSESWNGSLICVSKTNPRDIYPCRSGYE